MRQPDQGGAGPASTARSRQASASRSRTRRSTSPDSPFVVNDRLDPLAGRRRASPRRRELARRRRHQRARDRRGSAETADGWREDRTRPPRDLAISARNRKALDDLAARLCDRLRDEPDLDLDDVAYTLINGRRRLRHRRVHAVADRQDAIHALSAPDDTTRLRTTFQSNNAPARVLMFPGGGAQYPAMGRSSISSNRVFHKTVDEGLAYLPAEISAQICRLWLVLDANDAGRGGAALPVAAAAGYSDHRGCACASAGRAGN